LVVAIKRCTHTFFRKTNGQMGAPRPWECAAASVGAAEGVGPWATVTVGAGGGTTTSFPTNGRRAPIRAFGTPHIPPFTSRTGEDLVTRRRGAGVKEIKR